MLLKWIAYLFNQQDDYWFWLGKKILSHLPESEHQPFINWVAENPTMQILYSKYPYEALKEWQEFGRYHVSIKAEDESK